MSTALAQSLLLSLSDTWLIPLHCWDGRDSISWELGTADLLSLLWRRHSILTEGILTNAFFIEILVSTQKVLTFAAQNFSATEENSLICWKYLAVL